MKQNSGITRRSFLKAASVGTLSLSPSTSGLILAASKRKSTDIRMKEISVSAAAQEMKMYMTAQDLTCPGASLIQSAGIAAHVRAIDTLESNAREYVPSANKPWLRKFPGLFEVRDGKLHTANLTGPGLSAV